jgi:predicted transcriptional regulator
VYFSSERLTKYRLYDIICVLGVIGLNKAVEGLISLRKRWQVTQRELSVLSGVVQGYISEIENYRLSPTVETMNKLLKPLGCELRVVVISDDEKS